MRLALAIALLGPTTVYAQPAPDAEPAPGVGTSPTPPPTEAATPTPQPNPAGKPARTFGIDAGVVIPLSDYADDAKLGFGVMVRYELPRSEAFSLTLRAGGLAHVAAENRDALLLVPALFGIELRFADPWFLTADAGLVFRYQGKGAAALGLAFGAGYRTGKIAIRAEILVPDLGVADSTAGVMATVGYSL